MTEGIKAKEKLNRLVDRLLVERVLDEDDFVFLIDNRDQICDRVFAESRKILKANFSGKVYVRGLIEISSFCKNDCFYCGIRKSNIHASRYRLSKEEIMKSIKLGSDLGFNSFVLQGGEDPGISESSFIDIIKSIKAFNSNAALTLSVGEKEYKTLKEYREAGADRFLLRHETKNREHYYKLHPEEMNQEFRLTSLDNLKKLGFQTGSGIMVGSPGQTSRHIAEDLIYLHELEPEMIGIGPFVAAKNTPFAEEKNGSAELTVYILALLRIMFPRANLPATTSLATLSPELRDKAIKYAANVYMPNLTPNYRRKEYALYDEKACFEIEAAENLQELSNLFKKLGYRLVMDRGDYEDV